MPAWRTRSAVPNSRRIALVSFVIASISAGGVLAGAARTPKEPERLSVTAVAGSVSVTMAGVVTAVQPESTVSLPARIVTGDDGMLGLTQAGTNITIAADSDIEIPAEAADGRLIARLVQHRGQVFYDVAHRNVGTLRVETPFLVAVIKGTQFNVAVQESSTTISLFQGRLDIRTPDSSETIQLNAGEIAIRGNADNAIRVLGMNEKRAQVPARDGASPPSLGAANVDLGRIGATIGGATSGANAAVTVQPSAAAAPTIAVDLAPTSGAEGAAVNLGSGAAGRGAAGAVVTLGSAASAGGALGTGATGLDLASTLGAAGGPHGSPTTPPAAAATVELPVVAPAPTAPAPTTTVVLPLPAPVPGLTVNKP